MLLGQMSPWQLASVKDGSRNLHLKFAQNRVSNSQDIPDMDKCCQDKCCLHKCHLENCNLFKIVLVSLLGALRSLTIWPSSISSTSTVSSAAPWRFSEGAVFTISYLRMKMLKLVTEILPRTMTKEKMAPGGSACTRLQKYLSTRLQNFITSMILSYDYKVKRWS